MPTIALERPETRVEPGYRGFLELAAAGLDLEPFQRRIARAALGPERELLVLLPRGNSKTCLQALVALHHLLPVSIPAVERESSRGPRWHTVVLSPRWR